MTCFLSSHVLGEVKKYCRHAGILRDGRLVKADSVKHLTESSLRKVKLSGVETLPGLQGIYDLIKNGDEYTFTYRGEMRRLLEALQGLPVKDLLITDPSLEEAFMQYYEREEIMV